MVVIKYVGKTSNHVGKTLWDIVGNLKNFGVGRTVVRTSFERYPEKTFYKIVSVRAQPVGGIYDSRKVHVEVEKTFRGYKHEHPKNLFNSSFYTDFRLLSKEEEIEYCKVDVVHQVKVLPNDIEMPPMMRKLVFRDYEKKGIKYDPAMTIKIPPRNKVSNQLYDFKDSGEECPEAFPNNLELNKTKSQILFNNIKRQKEITP